MNAWRWLLPYARGEAAAATSVLLLTLLGAALEVLGPWPLKLIIDHVLSDRPLPEPVQWLAHLPGGGAAGSLLLWLALGTILLFATRRLALLAQRYLETGLASRMVHALGADLFAHLQRRSLPFHYRQRRGDLVRRVTSDTNCIRDFLVDGTIPLLTACASLVMMFAVMWQLDRGLATLALLAALPMAFLIRVFMGSLIERSYEQSRAEGQIMALAEQNLNALPAVQAFGREASGDREFRGLSGEVVRANLQITLALVRFRVGVSGATAVGTAVIMTVGGLHVLQGTLTIGGLVVILSYLAALYGPLETLADVSSRFAAASGRARRVLEVLEAEEGVREAARVRPLPERGGHGRRVCLERVTVGYVSGRAALHEIDLDVRAGETVALVGPTGAGKTTLASLIPRFLDPWSGRVSLDGVDLRELALADLRAEVALVLQEPFLLPLSVAENIAYGRPDAGRGAIEAAAAAANADAFIRDLPDGYDSVLGEGGATLSGGQRQRLALARAFLKDAPVLILDEPTSALDSVTEAAVLDAATRLMRGRTTLIIAHRLSTVRHADRIVVLEAGRIVETGSHHDLLAAHGLYHRLHHLQSGAEPPEPKAATAAGGWPQ